MDDRLRERHFGAFTLRNKAFIQRDVGLRSCERALYGDKELLPDEDAFSGFYDRVLAFLRDEIHPLLVQGKRVLVVTHKYVIELLSRLVLRLRAEDGYDIRFPNARLLNAASMRAYLVRESRKWNYFQDWIVLNHAFVLLAGVLIGITLRILDLVPVVSPRLGFGLLSVATVISLARVAPLDLNLAFADGVIPASRVLVRYAVLPPGRGPAGPGQLSSRPVSHRDCHAGRTQCPPAVLALTLFVILSFQSIHLDTFLPFGMVAIVLGMLLRFSALLLLRRNSPYSIDDYVSMSYPNIFLVILLASLLEFDELLHVSTWFLVPMFALAPLDEWLCRRIHLSGHDARLLSFLKIERTAVEEED